MNRYRIECLECEDEMFVETSVDIPSYCPLCGGDDLSVIRQEEVLEWDEDE